MRNNCFKAMILAVCPVLLAYGADAASVGPSGYTNAFGTQPAVADWSTFSIGGAAATLTTAAQLDAAAQAVATSSINVQLVADNNDPPAALSNATWCSSALYVQTRPTGNN